MRTSIDYVGGAWRDMLIVACETRMRVFCGQTPSSSATAEVFHICHWARGSRHDHGLAGHGGSHSPETHNCFAARQGASSSSVSRLASVYSSHPQLCCLHGRTVLKADFSAPVARYDRNGSGILDCCSNHNALSRATHC